MSCTADRYWSARCRLRAPEASAKERGVSNVVIESNRWEEVKKHWSSHDRIHLNAGTTNIMIRNNFLQATNASAITAGTIAHQKFHDGKVDRKLKNIQILSNTVINSGTQGAFLTVRRRAARCD
jgi:pectate lyase